MHWNIYYAISTVRNTMSHLVEGLHPMNISFKGLNWRFFNVVEIIRWEQCYCRECYEFKRGVSFCRLTSWRHCHLMTMQWKHRVSILASVEDVRHRIWRTKLSCRRRSSRCMTWSHVSEGSARAPLLVKLGVTWCLLFLASLHMATAIRFVSSSCCLPKRLLSNPCLFHPSLDSLKFRSVLLKAM